MRVDPITDPKDIKSIKRLLKDNIRDKLLFVVAINTGLRIQDVLSLRLSQLIGCDVGARVYVKEKKTKKDNCFIVNKEIFDAFQEYLETVENNPEHYVFKSRKGKNYPLTTYAVMHMVKAWCKAINLTGNYGAVTLRKTFCYQQRKVFKSSWELISVRLNHSSPSITRRYLGIQSEEVEEILLNNI